MNEEDVPASNIIAITFTNMAAEEMKERLSSVENIGDVFVGTIHSFANKVIRLQSDKNYRIYCDEIDNNLVDMGRLPETALQELLLPSEQAELDLIERGENEIEAEAQLLGGIDKVQYPESVKSLCRKRNVITFDKLLRMATSYFKSINAQIV